jgi:hypothetical protein
MACARTWLDRAGFTRHRCGCPDLGEEELGLPWLKTIHVELAKIASWGCLPASGLSGNAIIFNVGPIFAAFTYCVASGSFGL